MQALFLNLVFGFILLSSAKAQEFKVMPEALPPLSLSELRELPCVKAKTCALARYVARATDGFGEPIVWKYEKQDIHLLGAGMKSSNDESIAVACVDAKNECTRFQFIYYVGADEVYRVGNQFEMRPVTVNHQVLSAKETVARLVRTENEGVALLYQRGWNWSSQPLKVRQKRFDEVASQIFDSSGDSRSSVSTIFAVNPSMVALLRTPNRVKYDDYMLLIKQQSEKKRSLSPWIGSYDYRCDPSNRFAPTSVSIFPSSNGKDLVLEIDGQTIELNQIYNGDLEKSYFYYSHSKKDQISWTRVQADGTHEITTLIYLTLVEGKPELSFSARDYEKRSGEEIYSHHLNSVGFRACLIK